MNLTGQPLRLVAQARRAAVPKVADSACLALQNRPTPPHPTGNPSGPARDAQGRESRESCLILSSAKLQRDKLLRDGKGETARTSQKYVANRLSLDRKTVGRTVKRLQTAGLLDVRHRGGFRRGPSTYRLRPTPADNAPRERP